MQMHCHVETPLSPLLNPVVLRAERVLLLNPWARYGQHVLFCFHIVIIALFFHISSLPRAALRARSRRHAVASSMSPEPHILHVRTYIHTLIYTCKVERTCTTLDTCSMAYCSSLRNVHTVCNYCNIVPTLHYVTIAMQYITLPLTCTARTRVSIHYISNTYYSYGIFTFLPYYDCSIIVRVHLPDHAARLPHCMLALTSTDAADFRASKQWGRHSALQSAYIYMYVCTLKYWRVFSDLLEAEVPYYSICLLVIGQTLETTRFLRRCVIQLGMGVIICALHTPSYFLHFYQTACTSRPSNGCTYVLMYTQMYTLEDSVATRTISGSFSVDHVACNSHRLSSPSNASRTPRRSRLSSRSRIGSRGMY